jgi:hypothetical protein
MRPIWLVSVAARIALGAVLGLSDPSPLGKGLIVMLILAVPLGIIAGIEPRVRDLTYFIAPIYGRQLARAHAIAAVTAAFAFPCAFWVTYLLSTTFGDAADYDNIGWLMESLALFSGIGAIVAALIGLSATLRQAIARAAYIVLACLAGYLVTALSLIAVSGPETPLILGALTLPLLLGFLALRAFGETLARYDPTP